MAARELVLIPRTKYENMVRNLTKLREDDKSTAPVESKSIRRMADSPTNSAAVFDVIKPNEQRDTSTSPIKEIPTSEQQDASPGKSTNISYDRQVM